jgi:uncharacterized delta-60 repeat protein
MPKPMATSLASSFASKLLCVGLLLAEVFRAQAGPGGVDPTFDPGSSPDFTVFAMALQADGKLIIGGEFGTPGCGVARLNTDGTVDESFNPGTGVNAYGYIVGLSQVYAVAVQPDGKVLVAGTFATFNGVARSGIARLNADGSLDTTFDPGTGAGGPNPEIYCLALQADGKVLVGGTFNSINETNRNGIARLNANGSLDTSFDPGTGVNGLPPSVYALASQTNGQVLVAGFFSSVNGTNRNQIARLNSNGSLDTSFDPGIGPNNAILSMAVQHDGKMVIGGRFTKVGGTNQTHIARLNYDGTLDTNFTATGTSGGVGDVCSIALQSDGKVVLGGKFTLVNGVSRKGFARLNSGGTLDAAFNPGTGAQSDVLFVAVQTNDQAIIGGAFTSVNGVGRNYVVRLNLNGAVDDSFDPGGSPNTIVNTLALESDGRLIIGGTFTNINQTGRGRIARLNADGSVDASFDPGTGVDTPSSAAVYSVTIQSNGQTIVGGVFSSVNGTARNAIARLNGNGSLDGSYNPALTPFSVVYACRVQPDQKAIIGGTFTTINTTNRARIARLGIDGSLDLGFNPGSGANSPVRTVALQTDGKVIIGGDFTTFNGTNRNSIARLNTDGSLDLTFDPGTGVTQGFPTHVQALALQADGKVLVGGRFGAINDAGAEGVARLNTDGSRDTNFFSPQIGSGITVYSLATQPDGKVLMGGEFVEDNGLPCGHVARLNANGNLDLTFNAGIGTTGPVSPFVYALALRSDGRVLLGGGFTAVNHSARWWVAQLFGDAPVLNPLVVSNGLITLSWGAITGSTYRVQFAGDLALPFWTNLPPDIVATAATAFKTDTPASAPRFYRVTLLP